MSQAFFVSTTCFDEEGALDLAAQRRLWEHVVGAGQDLSQAVTERRAVTRPWGLTRGVIRSVPKNGSDPDLQHAQVRTVPHQPPD